MHFRHIPKDLQERVYEYYEYRFQGRVFNEDQILEELNPVLRRTVLQYNQLWLINTAEMFEDCSTEFKDALCDHFNFELYLAGDKLYETGDRATKVFFLARGTVNIIVGDEIVGRKIDGEMFGELPLVFPKFRRMCDAVCESCCWVYELSLEEFNRIIDIYAKDKKHILQYAKFRIQAEKAYLENDIKQSDSTKNFFDGYDPDNPKGIMKSS